MFGLVCRRLRITELVVDLTGATANDRQWLVGFVAHGNSMPKYRQAAVTVIENAGLRSNSLSLRRLALEEVRIDSPTHKYTYDTPIFISA